jgi:hypothetical protein
MSIFHPNFISTPGRIPSIYTRLVPGHFSISVSNRCPIRTPLWGNLNILLHPLERSDFSNNNIPKSGINILPDISITPKIKQRLIIIRPEYQIMEFQVPNKILNL